MKEVHPYISETRIYQRIGLPVLLIWINAPEGTIFDIAVEDYNNQWLCSGTSEIVIDVTEIPLDMTRFQRGTSHLEAYSPPP